MRVVIRNNFRQLIEIDRIGTPVARTKEKLWRI
jgi:hypothetical protein